ncbi:MAG: IPT/TIG domain-containing protein [Chloroflexi bacterium]|nr:IPT/TIG domain-containing protein [Chloroflexota bacterium]
MRLGGLRLILGVMVIFSVLAALLPAAPALAQRSLTVSPTQQKVGNRVDISGVEYTASAGETDRYIDVYISDQSVDVSGNISKNIDNDITRYKRVIWGTPVGLDGKISAYFNVPETIDEGVTGTSSPFTVAPGTYYVYTTREYTNPAISVKLIAAKAALTVIAGSVTLSPATGKVGSSVTASGSQFAASQTITIKYDGTTLAKTGSTSTSSTGTFSSTIQVPPSASGAHTITVTVGGVDTTAQFTVQPNLTLEPATGLAGSQAVIRATGFAAQSNVIVQFNNNVLKQGQTDALGNLLDTFSVPQLAAGAYDVRAQDASGNTLTVKFTIPAPAPPPPKPAAAVSLSPTSGIAGTSVTVTGSNFPGAQDIAIKFDNAAVSIKSGRTNTDAAGAFSSVIDVPTAATGAHTVTITAGGTSATAQFTLTAPPPPPKPVTVANLVPAAGNVGTEVVVSGVGFQGGKTITIKYDDQTMTTVTANTTGQFRASFKAPASKAGARKVTASDGASTAEMTFTMESMPPLAPEPMLPEMGVKVKSPIAFDWKDVKDESLPVTYTLQIAGEDDFNAASILLEKKGLTRSEYSLTEAEEKKLEARDEPYFWRVRVIDAASNEGSWTGAGEFIVPGGFQMSLPKWAQYTFLGLGGLFLFAVGFWVGRRTSYY